MTKLWGGRFTGSMDAIMTELNASMPFDVRLWHEDITGSIAYAHAAALAGIITPEEADHIVTGLQAIHDHPFLLADSSPTGPNPAPGCSSDLVRWVWSWRWSWLHRGLPTEDSGRWRVVRQARGRRALSADQ